MPVMLKTAWLFWWYLSYKIFTKNIWRRTVYQNQTQLSFKYFVNLGLIPKLFSKTEVRPDDTSGLQWTSGHEMK